MVGIYIILYTYLFRSFADSVCGVYTIYIVVYVLFEKL